MSRIDPEIKKLLLEAKAPPNLPLSNLSKTLQFAVRFGPMKLITLLVISGANVNHRRKNKETPLHGASQIEQPQVIKLLLDEGAEKDSYDSNNFTPLHHAVMRCYTLNIGALLNARVSININKSGYTPLFCLAYFSQTNSEKTLLKKQSDTIKYLIDHKADVDLRPFHKLPPIYYLAYWGNKSAVRHLLRAGGKAEIESVHDSKKSKNQDTLTNVDILLKADPVITLIKQEERFWKKISIFARRPEITDIITDYAELFAEKSLNNSL